MSLRFVLLILGLGLTQPLMSDTKENPARLMIVHSYEQDHVCGAPQAAGVISALAEKGWRTGVNLEVRSYYMDTKKTHTTPTAIRDQAGMALQIIEQFKPEVVVVLDDNAIREVMLPLVGRAGLSVVFTGMNGQPEAYNRKRGFMHDRQSPGSNVTGVYEKLWVSKSLVVMNAAVGDPDSGPGKVVGITDYSPTGNAITRQFELELAKQDIPVEWTLRRVRDFTQYQALIQELNRDESIVAIYPAALSLKTEQGETYTAKQIFKWTVEHSRKPEMALNYFFSKIGLFGGAAVDFGAMGRMAGLKAADILNGTAAGRLPIEDARDYAIVFNLTRANTLNIKVPDALLTAADHVYH